VAPAAARHLLNRCLPGAAASVQGSSFHKLLPGYALYGGKRCVCVCAGVGQVVGAGGVSCVRVGVCRDGRGVWPAVLGGSRDDGTSWRSSTYTQHPCSSTHTQLPCLPRAWHQPHTQPQGPVSRRPAGAKQLAPAEQRAGRRVGVARRV
jgi:hypothetical protein